MSAGKSLKSYDHVAGFYDLMSDVYSFGQIKAAKKDQLKHLQSGVEVLFVGCGGGLDVVAAARHGCVVTAVDTSQKMIDKLERRLKAESLQANLICDYFQEIPQRQFAAVCPNFFLNCFPHEQMLQLLTQLLRFVQPGGTLMIADVAPPDGNILSRATNRLYLHGAMLPFWLMGLVHWHPNHDYVQALKDLGWETTSIRNFRMMKLGPVVFRNIVAKLGG